jgi:DNA modification methylase
MIQVNGKWVHTYSNAIGKWAGVGPYYAMFPNTFAFDVISQFTSSGDWVLDPFAGRFSSIYAATSQKRNGVGIEINPVGWVYGQAKLHTAPKELVEERLEEIAYRARYFGVQSYRKLPDFFLHCYTPKVLSFLLAAKNDLNWRNDLVDTTLMAVILICLHAKEGGGLSNQMRQSKAMAPDYSIRWWKENNKFPPDLDPLSFLQQKLNWRYEKGTLEEKGEGIAYLADSTIELTNITENIQLGQQRRFKLLFTSPPYYDITHYHYDQWLRYWMLGGPSRPNKTEHTHRGRFSSQEAYRNLLNSVFGQAAQMLTDDAVVYVRTDRRQFTLDTTRYILQTHFPLWRLEEIEQPITGVSQTALFGDFGRKPGEVDLILTREF